MIGSVYPGVPEYPYRDQLPSLDVVGDDRCGSNDYTTVNGTPEQWAVVTVTSRTQRCRIQGSYFVIQNSSFHHKLQVKGPGPWAVRNSTFTDGPTVGGGAINPQSGADVLIEGNDIHDWGPRPMNMDQQGINLTGTNRMWILGNNIGYVAGDSIMGCHRCGGPGPLYIAGNTMNDSWENAMDFKGFVGPVVAVCNTMSGYLDRATSNGEAVRVNDEGAQGELWLSKNRYANNHVDIAPYGSKARGYYLDERGVQTFNDRRSNTQARASGDDAAPYYALYAERYGLDLSGPCP